MAKSYQSMNDPLDCYIRIRYKGQKFLKSASITIQDFEKNLKHLKKVKKEYKFKKNRKLKL